MPLFKRKNRSWELNWHERTEKQRRGEVRLWSTGTMVGVICAAIACVAFFVGGALLPNLPTPSNPFKATSTASQAEAPAEGSGTEAPAVDPRTQAIDDAIASMSTEQKVAQLFIVRPESLTGVSNATAAGEMTRDGIAQWPVGGIMYAQGNLEGEEQTMTMLENTQRYSMEVTGLPLFLAVNEEGGSASPIGGNDGFSLDDAGDAADISNAESTYKNVGAYLLKLGFNVDFAPVADIANNPNSTTMKSRSFGSEPQDVSNKVRSAVKGFNSAGILSCAKHFPGIGSVEGDTHDSSTSTPRTLAEMHTTELLPFEAAISEGVPFVMTGHVSVPEITGNDTPASLSPAVVNDVLRGEMGYNGIIITDRMNVAAIYDTYDSSDAAVLAFQAGNDMILMPNDFEGAYNAMVEAVWNGTISEDRLNESLRRIIGAKYDMKNRLGSAGYATAAGSF